jgi:hypothetical protein
MQKEIDSVKKEMGKVSDNIALILAKLQEKEE